MQVHMSAPNVEKFIDLLISVPAEGYVNSFVYVMSEWTKQQGKDPSFALFIILLYSALVHCVIVFSGILIWKDNSESLGLHHYSYYV